ncbi:hypothetical protein COCSUDRAFT_52206 [Coccomyxa subellipsoidea C-169]|uniref:Uncharacterized protein n=1 Tax=Coccomyxa subellipsoidea (strain C-169) TaxID=574566 RepID=I0ZA95_COCSC|nr:hypothetical protein COCSUDRAFT_52206 [Coccomyxa subellipsoidea C-169]EIE27564.1 hypothetical protein COCSUDRAFT_52206 [Coccomyxa subellipsoidea C-169]|eukprot:XP_005652108.1 hypothetical protein COCSUDRAFT_52206 [Coccomyxa subellipsoidea C-169]
METSACRPSSIIAPAPATTTTSGSEFDKAEPERCRSKTFEVAHEHDKENVPPSHQSLGRLGAAASKGSLAASGKRKRIPLQDVTKLYASDRNFHQSVRMFR